MGCVASRIDKEERVRVCKERKKLMKRLVKCRGEFSDAQLAYLRALRNTGVTLRQFTESESLELDDIHNDLPLPPSPPLPLPPSPPPPPPFSPDLKKFNDNTIEEVDQEESIEIDEDDSGTPPPPPILSSSWDFLDAFGTSSPHYPKSNILEPVEENWAETKTEFDDDQEAETGPNDVVVVNPRCEKQHPLEQVDVNTSTMSLHTKDTTDMTMVVWKSKRTLEGIVKELDDYFLKASAGGKEIAVLMDINVGDVLLPQSSREYKRKRSNSAKVFSLLSWNRSSKSQQFTRDAVELRSPSEPCRPGAHSITLKKLYAEEQRLYKDVKGKEITKLEYERKALLLQKQEDENHDWTKIDKTRLSVENLESDIIRLQQSISRTSSSILELIDEELYPQLVALTSGLIQMWKTMYECHQAQNLISQQLNHLRDDQNSVLNSDYHHQATVQLEAEVNYWHNSFCDLVKSQREYVRTLCKWNQLTNCLVDACEQSSCSSVVRSLCEKWELALDRLPEKVVSDAIKSFLLAIRSIILQQTEEDNLQKKAYKLEKRLQKDLYSLAEMEKKLDGNIDGGDTFSNLSPRHPLSLKHAKTEALKKQVETEQAKHLNSVQVSRVMTLNNLKTRLPEVFQLLMAFSSASVQAIEAIHSQVKPAECYDIAQNSTN
ncbi:DUF632 domain-containing protein/DUF630 domain-containing protein [Quillaja saponaria]|uniref:DUF632 domain-containing protein/DUF630 domain-containing protein n=1 Tax=Quillaja saponaria TaxID=32244 RepID=A0AAD7M308_QUISA|nr:DUF632 domain-containing protein/DUF630 domain-containing protein [Quillaja saponaria]